MTMAMKSKAIFFLALLDRAAGAREAREKQDHPHGVGNTGA
jgi:hypothetical protein